MRSFTRIILVFLGITVSLLVWAKPVVLDRLVASVNSSTILLSDVQEFRKVMKLRAQLDPLFSGTELASQGEGANDNAIIDFLINENLIAQEFPISDAEVEQEISTIQNTNHIDRATLKKALEDQGFTFSQYFKIIQRSASKRNLIDRDIRTKVTITDADIKKALEEKDLARGEAARIYHLKILTITAKNYKTASAANAVAQQALKEIQNGEPFEEVAQRLSDDPSASSGGDLGNLTEDHMSQAIREQVKNLKVGETSGLLGSVKSGRLFILKLVDVKSEKHDQFEKNKESIRAQLAAGEYQHQVSLWLERHKQSAFIHKSGEATLMELPSSP